MPTQTMKTLSCLLLVAAMTTVCLPTVAQTTNVKLAEDEQLADDAQSYRFTWRPELPVQPTTYGIGRVVEKQLDAQNARDWKTWLTTFDENVELYTSLSQTEPYRRGKNELYDHFAGQIAQNPELRSLTIDQLSLGNTVVVHELRTGQDNGVVSEALITYQVEEGRVVRLFYDKKR